MRRGHGCGFRGAEDVGVREEGMMVIELDRVGFECLLKTKVERKHMDWKSRVSGSRCLSFSKGAMKGQSDVQRIWIQLLGFKPYLKMTPWENLNVSTKVTGNMRRDDPKIISTTQSLGKNA